jgi:hypothetical protein
LPTDPLSQDYQYPPQSYVVAIYQGDWYVGQVMAKEGEPEAEEGDQYILVSFLEKTAGDLLKWPKRSDILNMLKEDILFSCQPPVPCAATSSSRTLTYSLTKSEIKKAKQMFLNKAYYPTKNCILTVLISVNGGSMYFVVFGCVRR